MELAPDYQMKPSQCNMYNVTPDILDGFLDGSIQKNTTPVVSCASVNGYTYDQSEFIDTVVTDEDWVCDLNNRPTDLYTIGTAGLIVGTAFFSAFADWKGRKPAFYVSCVLVLTFQLAKIGLGYNYTAYAIVKVC